MINVNQITADLARMPDRALQQYAQMHRNDPYIVALALSESNRRRQLRTGAQAGAMQQQPSVVEQDIAQMAPEEVGIGALPERSLTNMAAGGIVAFEEGGEVERYQVGGAPSYGRGSLGGVPQMPYYTQTPGNTDVFGFEAAINKAYDAVVSALNDPDLQTNVLKKQALLDEKTRLEDIKREQTKEQTRSVLSKEPPTTEAALKAIKASQEADAGMYPSARPFTAESALAPSPAKTALEALAAGQNAPGGGAPRSGVDSLVQTPEKYKAMMDKFRPDSAKVVDPFAKQAEEAGLARIAAPKAELEQFRKDIADLGEFGAEREKRLKAREEKLGKQEGELGGLALLKAGFAMMSGTSPHAFTNIGAGAGVGVEEYTKGKEKIDAARERLDDAYAKLEEVRRGEKVANARELRSLEKNVKLAEADVKDKNVAALRSQLGIEEDKAKDMARAFIDDRRKSFELASTERVAALNRQSQAATALAQIEAHERIAQLPGAEQRLYMALGEGDVLKGFERAKTIMQETKKDLMTEYTEWSKANPTAAMSPDGGIQQFLKQKMLLSGLGGLKTPTPTTSATGQVRQ